MHRESVKLLPLTLNSGVKWNGGAVIESTGGGAFSKASTSQDTVQRHTGQVCCKNTTQKMSTCNLLYIDLAGIN